MENEKQTNLKIPMLVFVLVVIVGILGINFYNQYNLYQEKQEVQKQKKEQETSLLLKELAMGISSIFESKQVAVDSLSKRIISLDYLKSDELAQIRSELSQFKTQDSNLGYTYIAYADKKMILEPNEELPSDYDPTSRPWYQDTQSKGQASWTSAYMDSMSGDVTISYAMPIFKPDNPDSILGVLGIDYQPMSSVIELIERSNFGIEEISIIDQQGVVLLSPNALSIGKIAPMPALLEACQGSDSKIIEYGWQGETKTAIIEKIPGVNWNVILQINE